MKHLLHIYFQWVIVSIWLYKSIFAFGCVICQKAPMLGLCLNSMTHHITQVGNFFGSFLLIWLYCDHIF